MKHDTLKPLKLLLVEDSEDDALLLLRELKKGGYDIAHERVDTPEAMHEALERGDWDIIISDYNMPHFDGPSALRLLKATAYDIPFIAVSGAIGEESAVELLRAGAGDFIKKGNWARMVPALNRELREAAHRREQRAAETARRKAEARYRSLFENAVEGIFVSTPGGRYTSVNPAMARIHGYDSPEQMIEEVTDIGEQLYVNPVKREELLYRMKKDGAVTGFEVQILRRDGRIIWGSIHARAVFDGAGRLAMVEGMFEDVTERKKAEEALLHNAFYDVLTGLPNRALFMDRLERAMERFRRKPDENLFAMLFLDLDEFKTINDSLGHVVGDELLVSVGSRLNETLRSMDTVARFGGDEFAILVEELDNYKTAIELARRIKRNLSSPFLLQGRDVFTSASVGIVLCREEYSSPEDVLRDADIAMYQAKERGRNRFKVFNKKMHKKAVHRLEIETDLRQAIRRQEFRVHFQPLVNLSERRLVGMEALVRWKHPHQGLIGPVEFIPIAEDTGLIITIGLWVLTSACRQVKAWNAKLPPSRRLELSVNLSGRQLAQPDLVEQVKFILRDSKLDPRLLKLEITESVLMENAQAALVKLSRFREMGVRIAVDDFGTGYSSLAYLHRFPIDTLKIDRSFVSGLGSEGKEPEIVRTIVSLAHNMGMDVVAEGVENRDQMVELTGLGCEFAQGYHFSRPVPPDEMERVIQEGCHALAGDDEEAAQAEK